MATNGCGVNPGNGSTPNGSRVDSSLEENGGDGVLLESSMYGQLKARAEKFSQTRPSSWSDQKERIVRGPFDYMFGHPGKDIRAELIAAFNMWLEVPEKSLIIITKVVGMLHTASLLVDDVEDSSQLRRGVPVAHNIFGAAQTINSANYIYFCALQELRELGNSKANDIYIDELLNLHRGQGMELYWRDSLICPSEEDYLEMVGNKTGGLFRLAVKLMQAESSSDKDCLPLVDIIGLLFQILDDYKNISSETYSLSKGVFAEDLTEGKFSFPIIHAIGANSSNKELISILKQKTVDENVKRYAVDYIKRANSFAYTRRVMRDLTETALDMIYALEKDRGEGKDAEVEGAELPGNRMRKILAKMRVTEAFENTP